MPLLPFQVDEFLGDLCRMSAIAASPRKPRRVIFYLLSRSEENSGGLEDTLAMLEVPATWAMAKLRMAESDGHSLCALWPEIGVPGPRAEASVFPSSPRLEVRLSCTNGRPPSSRVLALKRTAPSFVG